MSISHGGGLTVLTGVIDALLSNGHTCIVFTGKFESLSKLQAIFKGRIGLSLITPAMRFGVIGRYIWSRFLFNKYKAVKNSDCVLSFNYYYPGCHNTIVYHINLLHFQAGVSGSLLKRGFANWVRDSDSHKSLRLANINIFESEYLLQCASEFSKKINTPSVLYFNSTLRDDFKHLVPPSERKMNRIIAVTSNQPHKNNEALILMMQELNNNTSYSDWKLVIVGGNKNSFLALESIALEVGVLDRIDFVGRISDDELVDLLSTSLCLVTASRIESFCMVAVEAMSVGCPSIVTNCAAMPESVGPWGQLVDASSPSEFAAAVIRYRTNDNLYRATVEGGMAFVKRYSKSNFYNGLHKLLDNFKKPL